jgi:hypothetical protein
MSHELCRTRLLEARSSKRVAHFSKTNESIL